MKIAIVHDQLSEFGGAERVLETLSDMWPNAPIYTAYYKKGSQAWERFKQKDIRVSWAQGIPGFVTRLHSPLRFLAPLIWNSFSAKGGSASGGDLSQFDVILSSASWYITKGFGTRGTMKKGPIEICYCHTPPRWLYGYPTSINWQKYGIVRLYARVVGFFMRQYDYNASQRVDYFIANSQETRRRIQKYYRRSSTVIYPPIEISTINNKQSAISKDKYYLIVSRLAQAKNIDIAIDAANRLGIQLKIVGTGPDEARLKALAGPAVTFLGHVRDDELGPLYAGARAFIATATDEDFGMTPLEAMSVGTPVIAYRGGGYTETVKDKKTGIFFDTMSEEALANAITLFQRLKRNWTVECIKQAKKFSKERFKKEIKKFVEKSTKK